MSIDKIITEMLNIGSDEYEADKLNNLKLLMIRQNIDYRTNYDFLEDVYNTIHLYGYEQGYSILRSMYPTIMKALDVLDFSKACEEDGWSKYPKDEYDDEEDIGLEEAKTTLGIKKGHKYTVPSGLGGMFKIEAMGDKEGCRHKFRVLNAGFQDVVLKMTERELKTELNFLRNERDKYKKEGGLVYSLFKGVKLKREKPIDIVE
jgi:hypothetical protein